MEISFNIVITKNDQAFHYIIYETTAEYFIRILLLPAMNVVFTSNQPKAIFETIENEIGYPSLVRF